MAVESAIWLLFGITWFIVLLLIVALLWMKRRMDRQMARQCLLLEGVEEGSLDAVLGQHVAAAREAVDATARLEERLELLSKKTDDTLQHVGLVRFNPFMDTGGHFSFALAVTDAAGDGYVLCNLHGRRESRLYAKPVHGWESAYPLSEEERAALERAKTGMADAKGAQGDELEV